MLTFTKKKSEDSDVSSYSIDMDEPFFKALGEPLIEMFVSFEKYYSDESNRRNFDEKNKVNFDNDFQSIVDGIKLIDDNTRYIVKGGEFPASIFGHKEVVQAIYDLDKKYKENKNFAIMGGVHSCIGLEKDGEFQISPFTKAILRENITYQIRRVLVDKEAFFNLDKGIVHHPWEEHHFRLNHMRNSDYAKTICHNHNPVTGTRVWKESSEKELVSFHKKRVRQVIDEDNFEYIPYKEKLRDFRDNHLNESESFYKSKKNHFLVDGGATNYRNASKTELIQFFENIDELI